MLPATIQGASTAASPGSGAASVGTVASCRLPVLRRGRRHGDGLRHGARSVVPNTASAPPLASGAVAVLAGVLAKTDPALSVALYGLVPLVIGGLLTELFGPWVKARLGRRDLAETAALAGQTQTFAEQVQITNQYRMMAAEREKREREAVDAADALRRATRAADEQLDAARIASAAIRAEMAAVAAEAERYKAEAEHCRMACGLLEAKTAALEADLAACLGSR